MSEINMKTEDKTKEPMVQVDKKNLDYLISELKAVREDNKDLRSLINSVADKGRLAKHNAQNQGPKESVVRLATFDGKIVTWWSDLTENFVGKNDIGNWAERHLFDIQFADGQKKSTSLREFNSKQNHIDGIVKKDYTNEDMRHILEVDVNGKLYKIEQRFVNR
jgi:hypothetical protein